MPELLTIAGQVSAAASTTPKLRSSCDGCGSAKVKCDRTQPQCRRCKMLQIPCVYEKSRVNGKTPRKRLLPDPTVSIEKRRCYTIASGQSQVNHEDTGEPHTEQSGIGEVELATANIDTPRVDREQCYPNVGDEQNYLGIFSAFTPSMLEWPQTGGFSAGLDILPSFSLDPSNNMAMSSNAGKSHSCPRESYEIFRDLICPGPFLHAPESNSFTISAHLDEVLHFNREAIDRLTRVLKCPCSRSGHRAMVHASSISRMLIWYEQAAEWTGSDSHSRFLNSAGEHPSTGSSSSSTLPPDSASDEIPPSLAQSTGFDVQEVPVSVGTFNIEDRNMQAAFRIQMILGELKKLSALIDMFTGNQVDAEVLGSSDLSTLSSHLGAWLRSEHSRIVKPLKRTLLSLHENMDGS